MSVADHSRNRGQQNQELVNGVEDRFLVLLQVTVVSQWQPFSVAISPARFPISLPAFPRASSATSGFFFCGMMLDPVDHSSANVANPNSEVTHKITSSPNRDRSTPI